MAVEHSLEDTIQSGLDRLTEEVQHVDDCSLYFGLSGMAFTLYSLGREDASHRALQRVRDLAESGRWGPMFELLAGNAGIGLGALRVGDLELAVHAVTPYLSTWSKTPNGVNWPVRPTPPRSHHVAHGTLGIVFALAAVGDAAGRPELLELAVAGAMDVLARNQAGPEGFLVPHSDPPHRPDMIERFSLGWCNGPAGDAQVFRLLERITQEKQWALLGDRCWRTVVSSGLPERVRPGFWDNNGRCCGTAGVLALACDRIVDGATDSRLLTCCTTTWRHARVSTRTALAGRTTNTGTRLQISHPGPDGPWATRESSASSCGTRGCAADHLTAPTRCGGPTTRPRSPRRSEGRADIGWERSRRFCARCPGTPTLLAHPETLPPHHSPDYQLVCCDVFTVVRRSLVVGGSRPGHVIADACP